MKFSKIIVFAIGLVFSVQAAGAAVLAFPQVSGPIPITAQSRPISKAPAAIPEAAGSAEREYFSFANRKYL